MVTTNTVLQSECQVGLSLVYSTQMIQSVQQVFTRKDFENGFFLRDVSVVPSSDGETAYIDIFFRTLRSESVDAKRQLTTILRRLIDELSECIGMQSGVCWFLQIDGESWNISDYAGQFPGEKKSRLVHEHQVFLQIVAQIHPDTIQSVLQPMRVHSYDMSLGQPTFVQYDWGWEVIWTVRNEGKLWASSSKSEVWAVMQTLMSRLAAHSGLDEFGFNCFIDGVAFQAPPDYVYQEVEVVYIVEPVILYTHYDPWGAGVVIVL